MAMKQTRSVIQEMSTDEQERESAETLEKGYSEKRTSSIVYMINQGSNVEKNQFNNRLSD